MNAHVDPAGLLDWLDIGIPDDVPAMGARRIVLRTGEVAVFRTRDGRFFALDDRCPHRGGPLSEGIVHGTSVTCPLHNLVIDLMTGAAADPQEGCATTYRVRIEGGRLLLGVPGS